MTLLHILLRSIELRKACLVPGGGIEPPTLSSSGSRSTTELPRPYIFKKTFQIRKDS